MMLRWCEYCDEVLDRHDRGVETVSGLMHEGCADAYDIEQRTVRIKTRAGREVRFMRRE